MLALLASYVIPLRRGSRFSAQEVLNWLLCRHQPQYFAYVGRFAHRANRMVHVAHRTIGRLLCVFERRGLIRRTNRVISINVLDPTLLYPGLDVQRWSHQPRNNNGHDGAQNQ